MGQPVYYKAVRPDGSSFYDPNFFWATGLGEITKHPDPSDDISMRSNATADGYLSVSTVPTDCTGFKWPCRLLVVEGVGPGRVTGDDEWPNKRRGRAFRVVGERPGYECFGPHGGQVADLFRRARSITTDDFNALSAAWDAARESATLAARVAARVAAWDAARETAREAAWDAAWDAACDAAINSAWVAAWVASRDAACALIVKDLISDRNYDILTNNWVEAIGPL